jgi:hypothetical protein
MKEDAMATCNFCKEDRFQSEQGVRAHLKKCKVYLAEKAKNAKAALGNQPEGAAAPDLSAPILDMLNSIQEHLSKQDAPPTPQQQRRTILQEIKKRVIDQYVTPVGQVTTSMRGHAKLMIEQQLARLPLEELGFEEACEIAAGIRDRLYDLDFNKQAREAERQCTDIAAHKKQEADASGAVRRADRRKNMFRQQASQEAQTFCQEKKITGWAYVSVLADIESRLEVFLDGNEPILEGQAIVRSVLDGRFEEAEGTLAAARAKADEQWQEEVVATLVLATMAGLVGLSLRYPEQTVAFFSWLEWICAFAPGAEASGPNTKPSETTPSAASAETRPRSTRRRKYPVAPPDSAFPCAPSGVAMEGQA